MLFGFLGKKTYPAIDRRREPRFTAEDEFTLEFPDKKSKFVGSSRDISMHGIRFVTPQKISPGSTIVLNFKMPEKFPGPKQFSVKAFVVRVYKPKGTGRYRVGCKLQHENNESKDGVRQIIHWLEHRYDNQSY
jgi:hypothetical protein